MGSAGLSGAESVNPRRSKALKLAHIFYKIDFNRQKLVLIIGRWFYNDRRMSEGKSIQGALNWALELLRSQLLWDYENKTDAERPQKCPDILIILIQI